MKDVRITHIGGPTVLIEVGDWATSCYKGGGVALPGGSLPGVSLPAARGFGLTKPLVA